MKYSAIKNCDIANGEGVRVSVFVSGCNHHCKGCFNKETWDFNHGKTLTFETVQDIGEMLEPDYISGLTVLGGEPLDPLNTNGVNFLLELVSMGINREKKNIWLYTGYTWDELMDRIFKNGDTELRSILEYVDVLVDGRFIEEEKDISLVFRGSRNQNIIDCKLSLRDSKENFYVVYTYPDKYFKN